MNKLTDESPMPFGKYKDMEMEDVPASYLIWLLENNKCSKPVKEYIEENLETLELEIKQKK